jgi:hypothetical protein
VGEALQGERMSRSASEPDSASLRQWKWPVRRMWMKPAIDGEKQREHATIGLSGVIGDGACGKIGRGTWETRVFFRGSRTAHSSGEASNDRGAKGLNGNAPR